jgi:hypothetical protein
MESRIPVGWNHLELSELIMKSKEKVIVAWIGRSLSKEDMLTLCNYLGVQSRQLKVGTREIWQQEIEKDCYVAHYHDGTGTEVDCDNPSAVHFTLQEWGLIHGNDPEYKNKTGDVLISTFDTIRKKRVIVDGIHRAAVMSSEYSNSSDFADRRIYEWYGPYVKQLFPFDFKQFYRV